MLFQWCALPEASWSWVGDSCQSCIVDAVVVMDGGGSCWSCIVETMLNIIGRRYILEVRNICGGVLLCSFRIAFVDVTYVFVWIKMPCLSFPSRIYKQRPRWRHVLLRRRDLWAKAWQLIHSHPDLSLHGTFECGSFVFSAFFRPILGKEWILWKWEGI